MWTEIRTEQRIKQKERWEVKKKLFFSQNSAAQWRRELIRRQRALDGSQQKGKRRSNSKFPFFIYTLLQQGQKKLFHYESSRISDAMMTTSRLLPMINTLFTPSATASASQSRRNFSIVWGIRNHRTISTSQREKSHRRESQTFKPPDISATMCGLPAVLFCGRWMGESWNIEERG